MTFRQSSLQKMYFLGIQYGLNCWIESRFLLQRAILSVKLGQVPFPRYHFSINSSDRVHIIDKCDAQVQFFTKKLHTGNIVLYSCFRFRFFILTPKYHKIAKFIQAYCLKKYWFPESICFVKICTQVSHLQNITTV